MKRKIIMIGFFASILMLNSCQKNEETVKEPEKRDFLVQTVKVDELSDEIFIKKVGKVTSAQDINISAQAYGKIESINIKVGDILVQGSLLIKLADTIANYNSTLQKSQTALSSSRINYDNSKSSLNKAVTDAQLAYEKAQKDYQTVKKNADADLAKAEKDFETTKKQIEEDLKKANKDLNDSDIDIASSQAKLTYDKLLDDLDNAKTSYNNLLKSNQETIDGFQRSLAKEYDNININNEDIIDFSDKLFGISDLNEHYNDSFDGNLGVRNTSQKFETRDLLINFMNFAQDFKYYDFENITEEKFNEYFALISENYTKLDTLLNSVQKTLLNSVPNSTFPQSTIDTNLGIINGYQASLQASSSAFVSFKNSAMSFINTYKDSQQSRLNNIKVLEQQIEISKKNLESVQFNAEIGLSKTQIASTDAVKNAQFVLNKTKIAIESQLNNAELMLKNAKNSLDNAIDSRNLTLRSLQSNISQSSIVLGEAQKELSKLYVNSPINGKVSDIYVDVGQEVGVGTPLVGLVSSNSQEVNLYLSAEELNYINMYMRVFFEHNNNVYTGTIVSISDVADMNLNYLVKVALEKPFTRIGDLVEAIIRFKSSKIMIPINYVTITNQGEGFVYYISGNNFDKFDLELGKVFNDKIQVLNEIDPSINIIITHMKNYDDRKFKLQVDNQ